jgi:methyl-accepting chemotaxis protein
MKSQDQRRENGVSPSLKFLKRLKLWQKFALLAAVVLPAVVAPTYQFLATTQEGIEFAKTEERGIAPSLAAMHLIKLTQQHRGLSAGVLSGNEALASARSDKEAENKLAIGKMDELIKDIADKAIIDGWNKTGNVFSRIAQDVANRSLDSDASFARHTELVADYVALLDAIVDYYKLNLDPDAHTYHLIQASLVGLPALTEPFGQLRALGTAALTANEGSKAITEGQRARLAELAAAGARELEFINRSIQKAFRESPDLAKGKLAESLKTTESETRQMLDLARREIVQAQTLNFESAEFFKRYTHGIDQQFALTDVATTTLQEQLDVKIAALRERQLIQSAIIAILIIGATLLAFAVVRSVLRPVSHLFRIMEGLRQGDTSLRARLDSNDEIGELGRQFDTMVEEREAIAARIKKENEELNNSIIDILRSVAKAAQGDLTAQAPVREDITGALSDAINSMADSTAKTLARVATASHEVRAASQDGRDTVLQSSRGMNEIRSTIQETGKRIKRLGERSQEITGIVKLIDDIAERTSVLALNANMQAAMAGEAGRGFRVVADEVQRLAERSKQATDQIGKLVNTIQSETNDTMATMDRAISEVVKGGELADKAAEKVTHLDELGGQLLESVQAFKLPADLVKQIAAAGRDTRRAA